MAERLDPAHVDGAGRTLEAVRLPEDRLQERLTFVRLGGLLQRQQAVGDDGQVFLRFVPKGGQKPFLKFDVHSQSGFRA